MRGGLAVELAEEVAVLFGFEAAPLELFVRGAELGELLLPLFRREFAGWR